MDRLLHDLRYALRRSGKRPGFTLIAVLSLALGIGANTAIFSLVQAILLRDPPITEPERVLEIYLTGPDFSYWPLSTPDFRDFQNATQNVFSSSLGSMVTVVPRDHGDRVEPLVGEMVSGHYFTTLGLVPAAGRLLGPADDVSPGGHPVAVLSYEYWERAYQKSPSAIGSDLRVNGRNYAIVGVAPRAYEGALRGIAPSVYVPVMMINQLQPSTYDQLQSRGDHSTFVRARMRPGVTRAQADAAVASFVADMKVRYRDDWPQNGVANTISLSDLIVNPMLDRFIVLAAGLLTVVVGLVLLIACANLASFLLAQARDRQREIAIRLAIGAGRAGLVRQLLTESVALALVGCVAAIGLAKLMLWALLNADLPLPIPITVTATLNPTVLLFAIAIAIVAGVLFGLAPALQATRTDVISTIKSENTGGGPGRRITLRNTLVTGQVAISLVLTVTAGLLLRSMSARQTIDPGFGSDPTALMQFNIPADKYSEAEAVLLIKRLEERIAQVPGVQSVGITGNLHLNTLNTQSTGINVEGHQPPPGDDSFMIDRTRVDPGFFDAAGISITRGRNFDDNIDRRGSPRVVIINQVMADRFWPGQDPIGRTFRSDSVFTIIGVASNAKIRSLGEQPRSFIYYPYSQEPTYFMTLLARTSSSAEAAVPQVLAAAREVDRDLIIIDAKTMQRHLAIMLLPARMGAVIFGAFATLALVLALVGVYGVVSYAVSRRLREVGIRMSLGARPNEMVRLLMRSGFTLVGIGGVIGIAIALLTARVLNSVLYGIEPIDPITFTVGPALLLAVGALAAWIPARRASKVDPARVLTTDR